MLHVVECNTILELLNFYANTVHSDDVNISGRVGRAQKGPEDSAAGAEHSAEGQTESTADTSMLPAPFSCDSSVM
jgi:hypothetical protein